jgi:hypothetical protein
MFITKLTQNFKLLNSLTLNNKLSTIRNISFNKFPNKSTNKFLNSVRFTVHEQKQLKPKNLYICNIDISNSMNNNLLNEEFNSKSGTYSKLEIIKYLFLENLIKKSNVYDKFLVNVYDKDIKEIKEIVSLSNIFNFDINSLDLGYCKNNYNNKINSTKSNYISEIIREHNTRQIKKITLCEDNKSKYKISILNLTDNYNKIYDNIDYSLFDYNFPEIDNFIFDRKLFLTSLYKQIHNCYHHNPERVKYLINYYSTCENISHSIYDYNYGYYSIVHKENSIDKLISSYLYYKQNNNPLTIIVKSVKNICDYEIENWNKLQGNIYSVRSPDKIINSIFQPDNSEFNYFNFKFNYLPINKNKPVSVNLNLHY